MRPCCRATASCLVRGLASGEHVGPDGAAVGWFVRRMRTLHLAGLLLVACCAEAQPVPPPGALAGADEALRTKVAAFLSRLLPVAAVRVEAIDPSDQSGLRRVEVRLGDAPDAQADSYFVTPDGREIMHGDVWALSADPWELQREELRQVVVSAPGSGPRDAPVQVVEFSDLQCPYCRQLAGELGDIQSSIPRAVRLVFMHFPSERIHPWARPAAEASVCVARQGEGAFWVFERDVFAHQGDIDAAKARSELRELALKAGATAAQYDVCSASGEAAQDVSDSLAKGRSLGVTAVPTVFLNGRPIVGAISAETLRALVRSEMMLASPRRGSGASWGGSGP